MTDGWDDIAQWYIDRVADGWSLHDFVRDILLDALPADLTGTSVLDLGCGEGTLSRALAARGARVHGIDPTRRMIDAARANSPELEFTVDDGASLSTVPDDSVDLVTAGMSLNNVADLSAALAASRRVLTGSGRLVFTVPHPCFEAPRAEWQAGRRVVGDYLAEGFWRSTDPVGVRRAGNQHRTVSRYLTGLIAAGFRIDHVAEPAPSDAAVAAQPNRAGIPPFLVVGASL